MSRSDLDYLRHVRDEAEYLAAASGDTDRESFLASGTLRRAFARSIEVIGEATKNLSPHSASSIQTSTGARWAECAIA